MKQNEGGFPKKVKMNDCIHEHMEFEPLLISIIDTPQFQRLRYIKQLGPAYRVYPSAAHNRFEHCLGVCHLAGVMMDSLERNTPFKICPQKRLYVRIAALCHDLGHGPFSHSWEVFINDSAWKHEILSAKILETILLEIPEHGLHKDEIDFIGHLIIGVEDPSKIKYFENNLGDLYLAEIVANKFCDIDVDKWDYLLRDSKLVNMPTGFDYKRLLTGVKVMTVKKTGETHISYRETDAINIYRMYMERANMHYYCYKHKAVLIIQAMILDALCEADSSIKLKTDDGLECCMSEAHKNLDAYIQLTDNILEKIHWELPGTEASKIVRRIIKRDFYTIIYSNKYYNTAGRKTLKNIMKENETMQVIINNEILVLYLRDKGFYAGNGDLPKNILFHDKSGNCVDIKCIQLFKQTENLEDLFYGELIVYCKQHIKEEYRIQIVQQIKDKLKLYDNER